MSIINPLVFIMIFSVIYCLDYCNPLSSICYALCEFLCMAIGYFILALFLDLILEPKNTTLLINFVLLVSIVLILLKKIINLFAYDLNSNCDTAFNIITKNKPSQCAVIKLDDCNSEA